MAELVDAFGSGPNRISFAGSIPATRRGYSSVGRASALQADGQRFDSVFLHKLYTL